MKPRHFLIPGGSAPLLIFVGYLLGRWQEVPGSTEFWKSYAQPVAVAGAGLLALFGGLAGLFGVLTASARAQEDNRASREQIEEDNRLSREQIEKDNRLSREQIENDNRASRELTERENRASREQIERENRESREQIERNRKQTEEDNRAEREQTDRKLLQTERIEGINRCWDRFTWLVDQTSKPGDDTDFFPVEVITEIVRSLDRDASVAQDTTLQVALNEFQQVIAGVYAAGVAPEGEPTQNGTHDD